MIDITADGHIHTRLCKHASGEMVEYVEQAIQNGLKTITFLEHLETEIRYPFRTWLEEEDFDLYFREGRQLQERYGDTITVKLGVETGYNPAAAMLIKERLAQRPWDHIGLSCHFFRHNGRDINLLSKRQENLDYVAGLGVDTVITIYFDSLIEAVEQIHCDFLCHLDAVLRYYPGIAFNDGHCDQIETLLDSLQKNGIALEINTSGIDYRGFPYPAPWIIRGAIERGIPFFAGSDAHHPTQVGRHFHQLPGYLQQIKEKTDIKTGARL